MSEERGVGFLTLFYGRMWLVLYLTDWVGLEGTCACPAFVWLHLDTD